MTIALVGSEPTRRRSAAHEAGGRRPWQAHDLRLQLVQLLLLVGIWLLPGGQAGWAAPLGPIQSDSTQTLLKDPRLVQFGRQIYEDSNLSVGRNMSCATCHATASGGTSADDTPNRLLGVHPGSLFQSYQLEPSGSNTFGWRNIQTNTYAAFSPPLHRDLADNGQVQMLGGNFWDGRAMGFLTGRATQEQATVPPIGTLEQGLPAPACIVERVINNHNRQLYKVSYDSLFGPLKAVQWPNELNKLCSRSDSVVDLPNALDEGRVQRAYNNIAMALFAYQRSAEISPFNSRYDAYLKHRASFNASEKRGLALFEGKAKCASCHVSTTSAGAPGPLFTDYTYDNLGVPRNPDNPIYRFNLINSEGREWVDLGLGGFLEHSDMLRDQRQANLGKFKVPTVRNVDRRPNPAFVRSYMHNGYFRSLEQVVDFYNSRDVKPRCPDRFTPAAEAERLGCWPEPEVPATVNRSELGDLGLNNQEQADLVAFLKTLSDR